MEPRNAIRYLTVDEVIAAHAHIVKKGGYPPSPLRNRDGLASAVGRATNAAHYGGADLIRQAAVLTIGISQAQAFVDGNKRAALAALELFLGANARMLVSDPQDLAKQIILAAEQETRDVADSLFEEWLRDHVVPRKPREM